MVLKVVRLIKKGEPGWNEDLTTRKEIFCNVRHLESFYDSNEDLFYDIELDDGAHSLLKITERQSEIESVALVGQLWLMNDKGETVERLF